MLELEDSEVEEAEAKSVEEMAQRSNISDEDVIKRLLLPGAEFGPYRILSFIASGGMGEVYSAERTMPDGRRLGPVALKVIAPEHADDWAIAQRFKREAQISRAIRSPHVTRVYEFGEVDNKHLFLAMEMLRGEELFERMYKHEFSPSQSVEIVLQILAGLRAVHESGFIHRDLKPENVYFHRKDGEAEVAKILDFGIAKKTDEQSDPYLSVVGKIYGTPEYIAPEQGLNPDVDERADLYSVGVILYELLARKLPFEGETAYAIILAHQNQKIPPLPDEVDRPLARIVEKALAKRADDRYQSAREFTADLRRWMAGDAPVDTADLMVKRERVNTPERSVHTPEAGVPAAGRSGDDGAPPVQIFTKTTRAQAARAERSPAHDSPARDLGPQPPPARDPREDVAHGSKAANVFTAVVVVAVIALALWVLLT